ncbi:hypothetical protein FCM35_KLT17355 [Carex littledalei]|uniref:CCHC-type domain-containing protein n=1 Tax=Carex littledalei TaxID=544730 RepID=A0A833VWM2_9POAL|nr:hypothetical protein FCM35_KLT17355 [Carex littledalei]
MTVVSNRRRRSRFYPPYAAATTYSHSHRQQHQRRYHNRTPKSRNLSAPLHLRRHSTYLQQPRSISRLFPLQPRAPKKWMGLPQTYLSQHLSPSLIPLSTTHQTPFIPATKLKPPQHSNHLNYQKFTMQNLLKFGSNAPQNSYASVLGSNIVSRHIPHPLPPQNQPWNYFLDQNPWSAVPVSHAADTLQTHPPLPLPPDPTSSAWKGRCYNCLQFGHDQNICPCPDRVCAICWEKGHEARACEQSVLAKRKRFDPLEPRGNLGDSLLPADRPQLATVFLPETRQMQNERYELNGAIIVDARLMPDHNYHAVQSSPMAACKSDAPFALTHITGFQYLLLLPLNIERRRFINQHGKEIQKFGLVAYPWTPGVNANPLNLKYQSWIELQRLSPQAWNLDHLIPAVSSFGVVLDHGPITNVRSLEKLMMVVALPDLAKIPRNIMLWVRGLTRTLEVVVHGWIEEPSPCNKQPDTTPDTSVFEEIKRAQLEAIAAFEKERQQKETVTVEFNTLLGVWESMTNGPDRDAVEHALRQSPCFVIWENEGFSETIETGKSQWRSPVHNRIQSKMILKRSEWRIRSEHQLERTTADPRPLSPDPRPLSPPLNIPTTHNPLPPSQTQPTLSSTPRRTSNRQPVTQPKNKKGKGKGPATPTQTLRRSARINGRSPQTEFYKRRVNTPKGESSAGLRKLVQQAVQEAKVIEALKEDNLKSVPTPGGSDLSY